MKIAALCCTYGRPRQLARLLRCFERQTHEDRLLIVLDDAGQYEPQEGDRWRIVSTRKRFPSLAAKRNACARLAPLDADAFAVWDDDDLYLPWQLSAHAQALQHAEWSRPRLVLHPLPWPEGDRWNLRQHETGGLYHGGWAFRRELFHRAGGYPPGWSGPEDRELMLKIERLNPRQVCPCEIGSRPPGYVYDNTPHSAPHISNMLRVGDRGTEAWKLCGMFCTDPVAGRLQPEDPPWFDLADPPIEEGVYPRPF